jgi:hypothetical protein
MVAPLGAFLESQALEREAKELQVNELQVNEPEVNELDAEERQQAQVEADKRADDQWLRNIERSNAEDRARRGVL